MENEEVPPALVAISDQMQAIAQDSDYPIVAVLILAQDGSMEVRSMLDEDTLREALQMIAREF